jgi:hypothetical protein
MRTYRFAKPPRALRRPGVQLDNITLVPASMLPYKKEYLQIANHLPKGSVLLCSKTANLRQQRILECVSAHLRSLGRRVLTVPAERFVTVQ